MIYHIATVTEWENGQEDGLYTPAAFEADGFIHLSDRDQIVDTANRYYRGQPGLVLLCVDSDAVAAPLRYEDLTGQGQSFPHIYGKLDLDAIYDVVPFLCSPDGTFSMPENLP